jgi:hypothetical protein
MASETVFRQNGPDVAVVLELLSTESRPDYEQGNRRQQKLARK